MDLEEEYDAKDSVEQSKVEKMEEEQLVKELPSISNDEDDVEWKEEQDLESLSSVDPMDEEALIPSKSFGVELQSAIDHVSSIAKDHREEMMSSIRLQIEEETGQRVTDEMMSSAMKPFQMEVEAMEIAEGTTSDGMTSEEEEEEEFDEELFAKEMEEALDAVRELAEDHRGEIVDRICDIYSSLNDEEPTTETLYELFDGIKAQFMELAEETDSLCSFDDEVGGEEMLAEEMEVALAQVRKQAQLDQEVLVDLVCDYYHSLNGCDPSLEAISGIFGRIKEEFAKEEREEFLALNEDEDDEEDEDYEVEDDESNAEHYALDEAEDIYIAEEHQIDDSTDSELDEQFGSETESDGDYDAEEDSASVYWADIVDEEELDLESESESEVSESDEEDEEQLVQSALFAAEWISAIDHIRKLAKYDQERIVSSVLDQMEQDTEESPALEMVDEAMDSLRATVLEFDDSESEDAEEELAVEMEEALENVRGLGAVHREQIAMRICDLYFEETGGGRAGGGD